MRALWITTEYPTPEFPGQGIFVARQESTLRRMGVDIDILHLLSRGNPLNHLRGWRRMRTMQANRKYDLIHAQFGHAGLVALLQGEAPVVVTFRGPDLQGVIGPRGRQTLRGRILVALSLAVSSCANERVVVSPALGKLLHGRHHSVIPSGLDLELFQPVARDVARKQLGWDAAVPVVLFAAQDPSMPGKRHSLAQEAVDLVRAEVDVRFVIASDVAPHRMPLYMNASDVLLMTSAAEGSPNVIKEAMACDLPVVSVDTGDVRERLRTVSPSAICEANARSLANAIAPLVRSPSRSNGSSRVRFLDEGLQCQRLLDVYSRVVMPP